VLRARVLVLVGVAGLLSPSAGCQRSSSPPIEAHPKIWRDAEATKVAALTASLSASESAPGGEVSVYRWENGFVEGWVQFDGDGGPDRTPLDPLRRILDQFLNQEGGRVPAAERLSGIAIVSRTKAHQAASDAGEYDWYVCKLLIQATLASADRTSTSSVGVGAMSGRLKVARREGQQVVFSDEVGGTVCRLHKPGMKNSDGPIWMELKVITPPDGPGG
jgi:hypothetical protein